MFLATHLSAFPYVQKTKTFENIFGETLSDNGQIGRLVGRWLRMFVNAGLINDDGITLQSMTTRGRSVLQKKEVLKDLTFKIKRVTPSWR